MIQSKGSVPTNLIALYKALEGGWQLRLGKDFVSREIMEMMRKRTNWGDLLPVGNPKNLEPPQRVKPLALHGKSNWWCLVRQDTVSLY